MEKKIIIIGAGMAGLSAGCYARMNGYEAEIYEAHTQPGGLCTAWKRKGYTIDGCIHWLTGSSPQNSFYTLWAELGAVQGRRMIYHDEFYRFTDLDGRTFIIYCDADKLEAHMKELSPEDSENIELLCGLIRRLAKIYNMPMGKAVELFNILDIIKMIVTMMPFRKDFAFCNQTTIGEFAQRFKNPLLREALLTLFYAKEFPLSGLVMTLSLLHNKDGGIPEGGSLEFARAIEKRFIDLGGRIFYKQRVAKILEEDAHAVGIQLADGSEIKGDDVISAADLRTTLYEMLDGKHIDTMHEELFRSFKIIPSVVLVSFGINMDLSSEPDCLGELYKVKNPMTIGNDNVDWLMVKNFCYDSTLAPKGKSVVQCFFRIKDFQYWEQLAKNEDAYRAEKTRIENIIADELERKYPGFKSAVEVADVATPMTFVRYTGNWKGAFMTWIIPPEESNRFRLIKKTVPGLENFWLSGMWVAPPGGVPVAKTSREIIQIICKRDKKKFVTSAP